MASRNHDWRLRFCEFNIVAFTPSGKRIVSFLREPQIVHSLIDRSRNAFAITETELKLMAAPAIIGLRSRPKNG